MYFDIVFYFHLSSFWFQRQCWVLCWRNKLLTWYLWWSLHRITSPIVSNDQQCMLTCTISDLVIDLIHFMYCIRFLNTSFRLKMFIILRWNSTIFMKCQKWLQLYGDYEFRNRDRILTIQYQSDINVDTSVQLLSWNTLKFYLSFTIRAVNFVAGS